MVSVRSLRKMKEEWEGWKERGCLSSGRCTTGVLFSYQLSDGRQVSFIRNEVATGLVVIPHNDLPGFPRQRAMLRRRNAKLLTSALLPATAPVPYGFKPW